MKTKRPGMRSFSVSVPVEYYDIIVAEADQQGRSMARQVEIIVGEWLLSKKMIAAVIKQERTKK